MREVRSREKSSKSYQNIQLIFKVLTMDEIVQEMNRRI